jgi:hypothetical protein
MAKIKPYTYSEQPLEDWKLIKERYNTNWKTYPYTCNFLMEEYILLMFSYDKFKHLCDNFKTDTSSLA